ncbi:MAG: c-type cytochrome [Rhodobacteraceae bacterium]|nr:c-type cytochrome [Paracoccaceae bacterium]
MMTWPILAAAAGAVAVAAVTSLAQGTGPEPVVELSFLGEPVTREQLVLGQEVYAANCASCHGANLEGQPDWKRRLDSGRMPAPPHDESGHTWHHSDQALFTITRLGVGAIVPGYESDMPAFGGVLSDAEIAAALAYIKSTWPKRERFFQADVTANDEGGT